MAGVSSIITIYDVISDITSCIMTSLPAYVSQNLYKPTGFVVQYITVLIDT